MPTTKRPPKSAEKPVKTSKVMPDTLVQVIPPFKVLRAAAKAVYGPSSDAVVAFREDTPSQKAHRTAKWARIMTKWLIAHSSKHGVRWQVVSFNGKSGQESKGIVDMIAIRKNHRPIDAEVPVGDLFEIVLIQVKGGSAPFPTEADVKRLEAVRRHHRADRVVLTEWKKGEALNCYVLPDTKNAVSATSVFGKVPSSKQLANALTDDLGAQS